MTDYCIHYCDLPNCNNCVSESFGCVLTDPVYFTALPPNMHTSVSPDPRQKAVVEERKRGIRSTSNWRTRTTVTD